VLGFKLAASAAVTPLRVISTAHTKEAPHDGLPDYGSASLQQTDSN